MYIIIKLQILTRSSEILENAWKWKNILKVAQNYT